MPCRVPRRFLAVLCLLSICLSLQPRSSRVFAEEQHPGTTPLTWDDDIASRMVADADRFLLRQLQASVGERAKHWKRKFDSAEAYNESIEPNRERLRHITGVRDTRIAFAAMELVATTDAPSKIGQSPLFRAYAVRWPTIRDMHGEGLLLEPTHPIGVDVIAVPDADQTPEQVAGLAPGLESDQQFARRLAESGCRVVIPTLIDRQRESRVGGASLTSREFIYRSAYELGRHLIGYELQQTFAVVDWFEKSGSAKSKIAVVGWGEGGMLALYAAALDTRIQSAVVSGHFDSRQTIWSQPIDRNVFGLLEQFGDAELASMVAPRGLIIDASRGPEMVIPGNGGAPAELVSPQLESVRGEFARAAAIVQPLGDPANMKLIRADEFTGVSAKALSTLLDQFGAKLVATGESPLASVPEGAAKLRQARLVHEMDDHNQWLLSESSYVRAEFMKKRIDTSSPENFAKTSGELREFFRNEVIGSYGKDLLPFNARSRKIKETDDYISYEVVLDVMPDVFAYGILIRPKGIQAGEKRPVVVCQHGLEGRPQDIVQGDHRAYHDFAAKLAERGFVTFSPQNIYIFKDRFRTLQRKSYAIKKTLFSIMVPQHQQIVNWLSKQSYVDPQRIAFYGLSYGGKSAMRIPPLVENYCLSICSADFNEWVWKNASSRARYSYVRTGEYEIFEFDLGSTFNYAEMATLIAPRPFMVERGHFDGVAPDEKVAHEFAKVRFLYQAKLKLKDRCEIEWFDGPHTINGKGTFDFLHKHLNWPK